MTKAADDVGPRANSLGTLNDHLFRQLDRLSDAGLDDESLAREVQRADAIVATADQISRTATLQLQAASLYAKHGHAVLDHLPMIGKARS